jgi:quinol monooxygenase YgiN
MLIIEERRSHATFVNVFSVAPENQDEVARVLVRISDEVASEFPGFISASTHKSVDGTRIFNYLQWRSPEDLAKMQQSPEFQRLAEGFFGKLLDFKEYVCEVTHVKEAGLPDDARP